MYLVFINLGIFGIAVLAEPSTNYVQCVQGKRCTEIGQRCCDATNKTQYCLGNYASGLSWNLAPNEPCEKCEKPCFAVYDPKCGSDGITYQNQCYFENALCRKRNLKLSHDGECIGPGACALGCADGFQLATGNEIVPGAYAVSACGEAVACVPVPSSCAKACPYGYYLCHGYDTTCIQYFACGETIWCKPQPLMPPQCHGTICRNNGYMTYTSRTCSCNCLSGYYGPDCGSKYVDNCQGLTCANNAIIIADASGCRCGCVQGYGGAYCQDVDDFNSCGNMVCHNGGILTRGAQGCTCSCLEGFFGESCDKHVGCKNVHCENDGFVVRVNNDCECSCPFGFFGPKCQYEHYGEWITIQSRFYDLCVAYSIDSNIYLEPCEVGKANQIFLVKTNYLLTWDERCLQVEGPRRTGNVGLKPCTYMTDQYWIVQEPAIKTFDKLCLDVEGGIFAGGRNVVVWDCQSTENQAWKLQPSFPPSRGKCPAFLCEVDPCEVLRCQLFPQATCEPDYCFCQARFLINGNEVRCDPMRYPDATPYHAN